MLWLMPMIAIDGDDGGLRKVQCACAKCLLSSSHASTPRWAQLPTAYLLYLPYYQVVCHGMLLNTSAWVGPASAANHGQW